MFRKDINGLRAIAVLAVMLFHFRPSLLPGGFAGVDVFFVISGYLMTGIILKGVQSESFSIVNFYIARANRIIPALVVLCFVLLVLGYFYLVPYDYEVLGKHVVSSATFTSNIIYWRESGYFNSASLDKWLLHTWSLSVEWQFYIIYPLVLVAARRIISYELLKYFIVFGVAISLAVSVIATNKWPDASYYLLPTRAWEMLIGGVAYIYPMHARFKYKRTFELIGIFLIVWTCFFVSSETLWPGYMALLPVMGTYFIIVANRKFSLITGNIVFQKIGIWSYSIYLWHWPIVVAINYYSLGIEYVYGGFILSILLGFISYKAIEKIEFKKVCSDVNKNMGSKPIYMACIVMVFGFSIIITNGYDFRVSKDLRILNQNAASAIGDWEYPKPNMFVGDSEIRLIRGSSHKNILFIGGSHIEQTYPYVQSLNSEYNVYYLTKGGCFITPSVVHPRWSCSNIQNYKNIIGKIAFDKIVTSFYLFDARLSSDMNERNAQIDARKHEFYRFIEFSKRYAKEVYIILGEPDGDNFDPRLSVRYGLDKFITKDNVRERYKVHNNALATINLDKSINIIDPVDSLCSDVCMVMDRSGNYYYKDNSHMRPWYARTHLSYLSVIFK